MEIIFISIITILTIVIIRSEFTICKEMNRLIQESDKMKKSIKDNRDLILSNLEKLEKNG